MRFLILGCNGMAGHIISLYLKEQGHSITGFARSKSKFVETVIGDAKDTVLIEDTIKNGNYDTVINCVGLLNQFAEDNKSDSVFLNGYLPHYLAKITESTDIQIVHMSTDCVFSGEKGGYTEESPRDGKSFYDRSKAIGEIENQKDITLRNSIVGPDIQKSGIGLLNWFMMQTERVTGFTGAIWTGQTTLQLAKTMEAAALSRAYGLYNMVPDESINKYELLQLFNKYIRKNALEVIRMDKFVANKSLKRTKFDGFDYIIPNYEVMIKELGEWMRGHKELYPHYELQ